MTVDTRNQARQGPPKFMNTLMSIVLRSPLHRPISNMIAVLRFTGRKTGRAYTIPVGYVQRGGTVEIFTDHSWWKNLRNNASVTLYIRGKKFQGKAEAMPEEKELTEKELANLVQQHPRAARAYGITFDANGRPDRASAHQAAQRFTLIVIHLL